MTEPKKRYSRPARTSEARENQLIALAVDAVEERIRNGTASAQELVHFLKLGSVQAQLEKQELRARIKLTEAKTKSIEAAKLEESFYSEVIQAIREYQGVKNDNAENVQ